MLYNLVYNRDCMLHEIVCETGSGAPYEVTKKVMEDFFGEGCYDKAKAYTCLLYTSWMRFPVRPLRPRRSRTSSENQFLP